MITFRPNAFVRRISMNLETLQIPALVTTVLALISLIVLPVTAMALSKIPGADAAGNSDSSGGASCDLPPTLEIEGTEDGTDLSSLPLMDKRTVEKFKTATFAMG
jgi:hypothetical protein